MTKWKIDLFFSTILSLLNNRVLSTRFSGIYKITRLASTYKWLRAWDSFTINKKVGLQVDSVGRLLGEEAPCGGNIPLESLSGHVCF